jgi:hypothetical protein
MDAVNASRLIIVHIGSKERFLTGAELAYNITRDYHGQMNYENFSE